MTSGDARARPLGSRRWRRSTHRSPTSHRQLAKIDALQDAILRHQGGRVMEGPTAGLLASIIVRLADGHADAACSAASSASGRRARGGSWRLRPRSARNMRLTLDRAGAARARARTDRHRSRGRNGRANRGAADNRGSAQDPERRATNARPERMIARRKQRNSPDMNNVSSWIWVLIPSPRSASRRSGCG